jgi:hypothetical protein
LFTGIATGLIVENCVAEEIVDLHMVEHDNMAEAILRSEQEVSAPQTASRRLPRDAAASSSSPKRDSDRGEGREDRHRHIETQGDESKSEREKGEGERRREKQE